MRTTAHDSSSSRSDVDTLTAAIYARREDDLRRRCLERRRAYVLGEIGPGPRRSARPGDRGQKTGRDKGVDRAPNRGA